MLNTKEQMISKLNTKSENQKEKIFFYSLSYDPHFKNSLAI